VLSEFQCHSVPALAANTLPSVAWPCPVITDQAVSQLAGPVKPEDANPGRLIQDIHDL